jgi:protein gp37
VSAGSGIEWTEATWNPVVGCTPVSPGCLNCYAATMANRLGAMGQESYVGLTVRRKATALESGATRHVFNGTVRCLEGRLAEPLSWRRPRTVFVNSMSDLFHEDVPFAFIDRVWAVMALCPRHTFQVLTKRPERMAKYLAPGQYRDVKVGDAANSMRRGAVNATMMDWPLPNVWLGVSAEDQERLDARAPHLLRCPAAVRFISAEPLLGELDLGLQSATCKCCFPRWPSRWVDLQQTVRPDMPFLGKPGCVARPGIYRASGNQHGALSVSTPGGDLGIKPDEFECLPAVDWVIVGGESGGNARPCDVGHIRGVVEQCRAAGVPCFVKQLGKWVAGPHDFEGWQGHIDRFLLRNEKGEMGTWHRPILRSTYSPQYYDERPRNAVAWGLAHQKGGNPSEWPADLRVREFPKCLEAGGAGGPQAPGVGRAAAGAPR